MNLKFALTTIAALLFLGSGPALSDTSEATAEAPPKAVAATVNGQPVYEDQVVPLIKAGLAKYKKFDPAKITPEAKSQLRIQALERVIETELLYQAGRKMQIPDLDTLVARKMAETQSHPSEKMSRMSEEELREFAVREIYLTEYMKKNNLIDPEVSEEEVKALYQKNIEGFVRNETALTRHILVQVAEEATAEERETARAKIDEARQKILDGTPFEEIAKEYSEDKNAESGGNLGHMERGYMPAQFDEVAFTIEPGALSKVIETQFGYHVLEVLERTPRGTVPYEQTRDFLRKYVQNQTVRKNRIAHMKQLRQNAEIMIFEAEKPPVAPAAASN